MPVDWVYLIATNTASFGAHSTIDSYVSTDYMANDYNLCLTHGREFKILYNFVNCKKLIVPNTYFMS